MGSSEVFWAPWRMFCSRLQVHLFSPVWSSSKDCQTGSSTPCHLGSLPCFLSSFFETTQSLHVSFSEGVASLIIVILWFQVYPLTAKLVWKCSRICCCEKIMIFSVFLSWMFITCRHKAEYWLMHLNFYSTVLQSFSSGRTSHYVNVSLRVFCNGFPPPPPGSCVVQTFLLWIEQIQSIPIFFWLSLVWWELLHHVKMSDLLSCPYNKLL